jgi:TPP-dependent pyruvate/acetoin dehydrogenase alpha subunit
MRDQAKSEVADGVEKAEASSLPDPSTAMANVFAASEAE